MAKLNGGLIMARALKDQGVDYMFGITGFPVTPIAREAQKALAGDVTTLVHGVEVHRDNLAMRHRSEPEAGADVEDVAPRLAEALRVLEGVDDADWSRIGQVAMEVHDAPGGAIPPPRSSVVMT